jgi:hypothetical protein
VIAVLALGAAGARLPSFGSQLSCANGRSVAAPLALALCTSMAWAQIRSNMFPATSQRRTLAKEVGPKADVIELISHHADIVEPAHRRSHIPIRCAVSKLDASGVRVGEHIVVHQHLVDDILPAHGLKADAFVDVFESAAAHLGVRAAAQQPHATGWHINALMRHRAIGIRS